MKKSTRNIAFAVIGFCIGVLLVITFSHTGQILTLQKQIANLQQTEREFNLELREQVQTEVHVMTWNQFYDIKERLKALEEVDIPFLFSRHNERLQVLEYDVMQLERTVFFPYVSQLGVDAPYVNDCGSAAILMVAKFYGFNTNETVKEIADQMVGGDGPTNYVVMRDFIEEKYTLNTKVVVTHPAIKEDLIEGGYTDGEDIEVIDPSTLIGHDVPMIWIYSRVPHWIVRYRDWAYDPLLGIRRFEATEDIYRPDYGLGIIVWP